MRNYPQYTENKIKSKLFAIHTTLKLINMYVYHVVIRLSVSLMTIKTTPCKNALALQTFNIFIPLYPAISD